MMQEYDGWHFLTDDRRTGYGNILVEPGQTLTVEPPLVLCSRGLHACIRPLDALRYAPGAVVCRVRVGGTIIRGDDKLVASERTVLWMTDATDTLRAFARWCALDVAQHWDMPPVVRQFLETGDETLRAAAWDAAWDAARDAAWDAARNAAWDRYNRHLDSMLLTLAPVEDDQ